MRSCYKIENDNPELFKNKVIYFAQSLPLSCILNSNNYNNIYNSYNFIAALDLIDSITFKKEENPYYSLLEFQNKHKDWIFGHFNYDLKNSTEDLKSENPDYIGFEEMFFFRPRFVIEIKKNTVLIWYTENDKKEAVIELIEKINNTVIEPLSKKNIPINSRYTKTEYIHNINQIKKHIQNGNIYEMNFCQEFFNNNIDINPAALYLNLCNISPTPFSCFYKIHEKYLCCASPERFLKKENNKIISQPIKGTSRKSTNILENNILKNKLQQSEKERSENIMIVDLVRNDLSKTAVHESVKVEELCGIYEFPQVFQMISTISSMLSDEFNFTDAINCTFPMGSMTGAPKIRAMQIIEEFERTKRGLFSGSVGYITPNKNFDFNVVIRSIQYNKENKYLSFITGGAITIKSDPEKEYEECMVKAEALIKAVNGKVSY
jgi:para-aminobenzoate synthetase component 1